MQKVKTYRPTKTITLQRGWVNPETREAHRVVTVRAQLMGDEMAAERTLREFAREPIGSAERNLAESQTGELILSTTRCITSWEGLPGFNFTHVETLTRTDYRTLATAIQKLDEPDFEDEKTGDVVDAGEVDPK